MRAVYARNSGGGARFSRAAAATSARNAGDAYSESRGCVAAATCALSASPSNMRLLRAKRRQCVGRTGPRLQRTIQFGAERLQLPAESGRARDAVGCGI